MRIDGRLRALALAALGAGLVALAGHQFERIFEATFEPWPITLVPVGAVLIGALFDRRVPKIRLVAQIAMVVAITVLVIRREGGEFPGDLPRAALRGLTSTLAARWPVPVDAIAVGGVAFIVAVAAAVAVELALARRFSVAVLFPSIVLLVIGALLAAPAGPPSPRVLIAYSVLAMLVLRLAALTRSELPHHARGNTGEVERRSRVTMAILGTAAILVGLIPAALGSALEDGNRFEPRDRLPEEIVGQDEISPLARIDEWRTRNPADVVFSTSSAATTRWRLVAMPRYDGRSWMPADDYRRSSRELRVPTPDAPSSVVDVVVGDLDARWLPAPDRVLGVSQPVLVDSSLGSLLVEESPAPGTEYSLTVEPFDITAAQLSGAAAAEADEVFVGGFELPPSLQELASTITAGATTPYERALRIASHLRDEYRLRNDSPAGHSINVLEVFLESSKTGRDEQFVAAYGLLAAAVGLPVRVAIGFDVVVAGDGGRAMSDRVRVWPEVEFEGIGWVAFDPVPNREAEETSGGTEAVAPVNEQQEPVPPTTAAVPVTSTPPVSTSELEDLGLSIPPVVGRAALGLGAAVVALICYVIVVLRLKSSRRLRRRYSTSSETRVTGAFRSGVDVLIDLGATAPTSKTDRELVAAGVTQLGGSAEELAPVAGFATQAVYDEPEPDDELAEDAWDALSAFEERAVSELGWWRVARAKLSLRSFRRGLPD
ncbi:MAG: DUF3488 and transglutaminase-like domain-containing protein [Acidimicrobiia bacterium]